MKSSLYAAISKTPNIEVLDSNPKMMVFEINNFDYLCTLDESSNLLITHPIREYLKQVNSVPDIMAEVLKVEEDDEFEILDKAYHVGNPTITFNNLKEILVKHNKPMYAGSPIEIYQYVATKINKIQSKRFGDQPHLASSAN